MARKSAKRLNTPRRLTTAKQIRAQFGRSDDFVAVFSDAEMAAIFGFPATYEVRIGRSYLAQKWPWRIAITRRTEWTWHHGRYVSLVDLKPCSNTWTTDSSRAPAHICPKCGKMGELVD